ncbi:telomere-associated protein RIF1 [Dendroctonus ponderosae]|uniref:telomere-associated protein RIF1 n=1 Tax=Dendroctonus ponderosae TaxID=77166 RepID=UPI002035C68D|nr:telomere-associated protein RIF1 [Dendroctonus ponderosae]KAH1017638.1 hypothetical protein HUJ05_008250 [Dendroctonus ponderosae]
MESQLMCSIYDEMADHLDATGNIIKNIDNATYIRHINLVKDDLKSTSERHRTAAFQVLRMFADNNIHSIQTDALDLLRASNIDSERKKSILSSLGLNRIKISLTNRNIEDLDTLNAAWNTTRSPQFSEILTDFIADAEHKQHAKDILLTVLLPYILDADNMQNESMDRRINLALQFASAIPVSALTTKESEELTAGIDKYIEIISQLRIQNNVYWPKLWIFFVRWFGTKLHDRLNLVNKLLRVVESAFRSSSNEERLRGYDCWNELIKNAGLNVTYLSSPRQLKLILTPLRAKFSKREPLITKRFELFVFLLEQLQDKAVLVLKEFLEFCFGEIGDSTDMKRSGFVKRLPELCLRCTEILLLIIGHSHKNTEKCLTAESDVHLSSPVVNSDNIENLCPNVLEAVSECSKLLENAQLECEKAHVLKCLWRSLLMLILDGQKKPTIHKRFCLLGTVLNNLLNGNNPYCQSIAAIIFEETVAMGKDKALALVLSQLDNFMSVIFTVPLNEDRRKLIQHFLAMFDNLEGAHRDKVRHHISTSFIQFRTRQENVDCVRDVWMYAVNELEDYAKGSSLDFLLWPVLYLQQLEEQNEHAIVCEHYKRRLVPFVEKSEELKLAFFKQLEKTVKNNPLLLANVLTILKMFPAKTSRKEIADVTFKMLDLMLSVPMTGGNKDRIVADIEVLVNRQLDADISTMSEPGIIQIVCTCIQNLLKQKHYLALPHLENLIKESTEAIKPLYLKSLDVDFLMEIYSKETETTTDAIPTILQMIRPLEVQQEQPAALPLKGRSAKIAKLVKEIPQSPTKVSSTTGILKYFGTDMETTPTKIVGSQLHKQQGKSPKNTPTSQQKKNKTCIDEESESRFVLIETEVKVDKNNLTDHQIETLKKRREDIPALYQDLSQSVSQSFDCPPSVDVAADTEYFKKPLELNGINTEELTAIRQEHEIPKSIAEPNKDQEFTEVKHDESTKSQNNKVENGTADLEHDKEAVELNNDKTDEVPNIEQENEELVNNLPAEVPAEVEPTTKKEEVEKSDISKASAEGANMGPANEIPAKKVERRIDLELKKLSMNIVGANDFFSVGSRRKRRTNTPNKKELQGNRCTDIKHVTADSKISFSDKANSETKKRKKLSDARRSSIPVNPKVLTVKGNHIDYSGVLCKNDTQIDPSPDQLETKLDKNKRSSNTEIDENRKIRKTSRISVAFKKVPDSNPKGNVGRKSLGLVSPAESLSEDDKPLKALLKKAIKEPAMEKMETDDNNQDVVSNGEAKAESKKVQKHPGRKRKRVSDSDDDDDIIESSQEPSISKKEPRTPSRGRRSNTIESNKSSRKNTSVERQKQCRKRSSTVDESIETVVHTISANGSARSARKRKVKAIVCKLLNFSAPNLPNVGNDHTYMLTEENSATGCDADKEIVDAKVKSTVSNDDLTITAEEENQSKNESKTEISPKPLRQLPESRTVPLRKSLRIQHEGATPDENTKSPVCDNNVAVNPEVEVQKKAQTECVPKVLRRLRDSKSPVVRKSPKNQQEGRQPKEAAEEPALAERSLSAEDLIKRTQSQDTQTQDSEPIAASANAVEVRLEVPQKTELTKSEQEIAEIETVSMTLTDLPSENITSDLMLYINDTLVEDNIVAHSKMDVDTPCNEAENSESLIKSESVTDPDVVDENPDSDPVTADVQAAVGSSLPSSPVTVETPNRNAEFLNNTVDISPINFKSKSDSEDEQLRNTKLVPIALKFDSEEEQQKSPEKADDAPLKTNETSTEDSAKESDSGPKAPAEDDQNQEVKSANKISVFKPTTSSALKFAGRRKINYMSPSVSRIKKLMAKVNPQSQNDEYHTSKPEDILTFSREVPSPLATPKIGILKRKHPDIPDDEVSPCPKRKRVNFSDPCTTSKKVFLKYDSASPQCLFPDDDLDKQFLEVLAANIESYPATEAESCSSEADCSQESINSLPFREDAPIYPDLINCEENIGVISRKLTAPMFVNTLLTKLNVRNLKTIGDLARLSEASIVKLPFKAPMVSTVFKVLDSYYQKNFKSKGNMEVSMGVSEAALNKKTDTLPEAEEVDLKDELSKIVEKAISAKIPPKTICSVVLSSLDQKQILTWFKQDSNIEVKDLVEESDFPTLVTHITKTLGVSNLIEMLTKSPETSKDFECSISQNVEKLPLVRILEKRSLDEVQAALWETVDKEIFSKKDLLQTCFLSRISVLDLNSFFNKLTLVEIGDIVINRLATEQYTLFVNRILKHFEGSEDASLSILNNFDISDLTRSIIQRGTPQEITSSFTCLFLSADKISEELVQIFRVVCDHLVDELPPSQLMELAIDFLRKIPMGK